MAQLLIYSGGHHPAVEVALVAVGSTVMAEGLHYSIFGLFYGMSAFRVALDESLTGAVWLASMNDSIPSNCERVAILHASDAVALHCPEGRAR